MCFSMSPLRILSRPLPDRKNKHNFLHYKRFSFQLTLGLNFYICSLFICYLMTMGQQEPLSKTTLELPPEQIAVLRKAFDGFDRDHSGSISTDMVAEILRLMGQPFNKRILEDMIEEVDADKSGRLEFDEFVTLAAKFIVEEDTEAMQKELREAFRLYDKEGNGYIPTSSLKEILRELDDQLTDYELDMLINEIDADGSGTVDFDEFMEMMTGE